MMTVPNIVTVLLPLPLGNGYTYGVPDALDLGPGDIVSVPLGRRQVNGVVWDREPGDVSPGKLKYISAKLDVPPLPRVSRDFVDWVAAYNMASPGTVLRMVMSVPAALEPPKPVIAYALNSNPPAYRATTARGRVLAVLKDSPPRPGPELAREAGTSPSVIKGLVEANMLIKLAVPPVPHFTNPDWRTPGPTLSADQAVAATAIRNHVSDSAFQPSVLEGVPGSGKTEVYMEAISEALAGDKQALVLLPEIALSAQWLERFQERFGCAPALWHSDLTGVQRRTTWRAVASGEAKVIVGARSALFLPYPDLGVIVIDEEHDGSFKQEEGVVYNARDMGVVRASLGGIPVALVSATPSLETMQNVAEGRYEHFNLPARHGGAALPDILTVDMKAAGPDRGKWLSPDLINTLKETFSRGEQALLFLNRRGYAPLTLCRACGFRLQCPKCSTWLVEHRLVGRLQCHQCGYLATMPRVCPDCSAEDKLTACGPGVERLAEEVDQLFPNIESRIVASDTLQGPGQAAKLVREIESREIELLIGTQIISKGYHFPYLTLVGVVDADLGLAGGDLRASERTYQLLYQVAGRAGRAERPGRVILQTYMPDHPVIQAISTGDRERFLRAETQDRENNMMPPFGRLVGVVVSGADEAAVEHAVKTLNRTAPRDDKVQTLGPAEAPIKLLRGRHRRRFLLKAGKNVNIQARIQRWLAAAQVPRKIRVHVDIDPYSFL